MDQTFTNVNRLLVLLFQRIAGVNNTTKDYRDYYIIIYQMPEWKTSMS